MLDGVEWNVRLSRIATPGLLNKFGATFDTYWNDSTFESYQPERDRDRLDDALAADLIEVNGTVKALWSNGSGFTRATIGSPAVTL